MKAKRDDIRRLALEKLSRLPHAQAAGAFFATPIGLELLEALEREFVDGDLVGPTVEETYFCLGGREVALYLRRLSKVSRRATPSIETGDTNVQ